jgi:hypothetical protein
MYPGVNREQVRLNRGGRQPMIYQIKVKGELDQSWSDWLGCVKIISERMDNGTVITTLKGDLPDQPALFGILDRIRDLNLVLISVNEPDEG